MRKPALCICENKGPDQLHSNIAQLISYFMHGSRKFSQGEPHLDQGWSNKFYHCKNPYFGKSRGGGWLNPLFPPPPGSAHVLCFGYIDSTIPLLISKSKISSLLPSSVAVQLGLCLTWSENPKTCFLMTRL